MSVSTDLTSKFRVIDEIEDNWDDIRVIVVTREDFDRMRVGWFDEEAAPIEDAEWESLKETDDWARFVGYAVDTHDVNSQIRDTLRSAGLA